VESRWVTVQPGIRRNIFRLDEGSLTSQDVVDQLGEAVGLTYQNEEPLNTEEKLEERDTHRWELEPASAEDFEERAEK
jgi:hypothetical protein